MGKKIVQFSLGTASLPKAKKRRAAEDLKWAAQFEAAGQSTNGGTHSSAIDCTATPIGPPLSEREAIRLVKEYVERMDERGRCRAMNDPPESEEQRADIVADADFGLCILRDRNDPRAHQMVDAAGREVLSTAAGSVDEASLLGSFAELVRRGLLELERRRLARASDDHRHSFFDEMFNASRLPDVTFGEVSEQFLSMTAEDAAANKTSEKWVDKQRANVALLREILGTHSSLRNIDYDACLRVRSVLARIPAHRSKLYGKLSLDNAIEQADADGAPLLSSVTQGQYLATLRSVLDLAAKKRLIVVNPADDLKPVKKDALAASLKRRPFTADQLQAFFSSSYYKACAQHAPAYSHAKKAWRFWLPLMCLFMGLRPNEACQMTADNVKRTPNGTWYLDIAVSSDEDESLTLPSKTLKTAASRRRVPIHPELIAIGFLNFAESRKQAGAVARIFPDLKPDDYGNLAKYALRRFRETFLPSAIDLEPRQSFYSFRHNFRDALRNIGAPPDALQALGGWSQGKLVSDDYGDKTSPDYQKQFMDQVAFVGLDVSHLRVNNWTTILS
jgi:integrase